MTQANQSGMPQDKDRLAIFTALYALDTGLESAVQAMQELAQVEILPPEFVNANASAMRAMHEAIQQKLSEMLSKSELDKFSRFASDIRQVEQETFLEYVGRANWQGTQ